MTDRRPRQCCAAREVLPYHRGMASSADPQRDEVDLNEGVDPEVRAEARTRVRRALAEARQRQTPEWWAALRSEVGLPAQPAR